MASDKSIALLMYGNGAELGNFELFATNTAGNLVKDKKFSSSDILKVKAVRREEFFGTIAKLPSGSRIGELHVFSHSIGGGLYLGYHDAAIEQSREFNIALYNGAHNKIPYFAVLNTETGGILTDHLFSEPLKSARDLYRAKFSANATVKLWGCNSGINHWVYTDPLYDKKTNKLIRLVSDQDDEASFYYWRALNTANFPKPSVAQALADYFRVPVFGATSGSHIEVLHHQHWITSDAFRKSTGHWPGSSSALRLRPDVHGYKKFLPSKVA